MKNIIKKIAFILAFVLMTEAVFANTEIYAKEENKTTLFKSIVDEEHIEGEVETTSEEIVVEDNIESGEGIILNLLDKLNDLKSKFIKDGVVSPSAIDYSFDNENIPDEILDLLDERYTQMEDIEKFYLNKYLFVREDTMNICCDMGLTIEGSLPYALIMQILNVDFENAKAMVISHESEKEAVAEAYKFGEMFSENRAFFDEENRANLKGEFAEYAVVGYTAEEVFNGYVFALLIDEDISDVIYDKKGVISERKAVLKKYEEVSEKYSIKAGAIEKYISLGYTLEELDTNFNDMAEIVSGKNGDSVSTYADSSSFDVGYDATFKEGALSYVNGVNDSVDPSTGSLMYSENICSLPGINGLDLNLTLSYTSNATNTAKQIDSRINDASNWRYNIPYITNKNGSNPGSYPKYITLEDGSTYELIENYGCFTPIDCFNDELKLYRDISQQGGLTSHFKLTNKNGDIKYFDERGRWIATYNRFGNSIKVLPNEEANVKLVIEDTVGRIVKVSETISGDIRTQVITMPDGNKTTITYTKEKCGVYSKINLTKIKDAVGNETRFEYDISERDNHKNSLLKKITMPTGLENHYEYEWIPTVEVTTEYGDIDTIAGEYDYARICKKYKVNNGKNSDTYNYSYESNFMYSAVNFNVYCGCQNLCYCVIGYEEYWKCKSNCNNECYGICPKIELNKGFIYTTNIESEGGTTVKYYFDALNQNIRTDEILGSTLLNSTYTDYLYQDISTNLPVKVRFVENGMERIERYTYTDKFDVKKYTVSNVNNTILSDISYEYDYESNQNEYYGINTKKTTKMNNNTNIVEEGELEKNYPYINKCIGKATVKRNGVTEKEEYYSRHSELGGRIYRTEEFADINSSNSIKSISTSNTYKDGFVNPTEVTYNVVKGNSTSTETFKNYYQYDSNERIISMRNAENYLTKYKYNGIGNITEAEYVKSPVNASGNVINPSLGSDKVSISYNYSTNTITAKNENGKVTVYDFDPVGNKYSVTSKSDGSAGAKDILIESYKYDTRLRPTEVISGKSKTIYTYDNRDRILTKKVTDKDTGAVMSNETYSYVNNGTGLQTTQTLKGDSTAPDVVTVTQQDLFGRIVTNKVGNAVTTYSYDMLNNAVKEVGLNTKTYEYDSKGNVLKTTETTGSNTITTTATYDMLGNILTAKDGNGNTTEYRYGGLNWVYSVSTPFDGTNNSTKFYTYDNLGNLISEMIHIDASRRRILEYEYDFRGRVIKTTNDNEVTKYSYDGVGNKVGMTRVNNNGSDQTTKYEYDRLNRLIKYTDGMGMSETYQYDDYGNLILKKDRNGNSISYSYDALGRCLSEKAGSIVNNFAYNSGGNLKSSSNGNVTQNYTYNNLGKIATEYTSTGGGYAILRFYDNWGRNTQNVYNKGDAAYKIQKYSYDELSRLKSISSEGDNSTKYTANYTYDNNSNITKVAGNNCTITYEYNKANLMTKVYNDGIGNLDSSYTYEYSYDGNIDEFKNINGDRTWYYYDESNRLTDETSLSSTGIEYNNIYTYDSYGNIMQAEYNENGNDIYRINYEYDKNNRLLKENKIVYNPNGIMGEYHYNITEYSYDNNGNILSKAWYNHNKNNDYEIHVNDVNTDDSVGYEFFSYDMLNELTDYQNSKGVTASYSYLPNHYRMSKNVNGTITQHIWDGDDIVTEVNSSNDIIRSYVRGHELLTDDERRTYMYDGHGNMVQQVKGSTVESKMRYDAYGNVKESANVNDTPFGYCGEYTDDESGFVYLRNRYYDPQIGRFITEDPIKDGVNWYAYCGGNPIVFCDPYGFETMRAGDFLQDVSRIVNNNTTMSEFVSLIDFYSYRQDDGTIIWYTSVECWQRLFGYNDFYDYVADNSGIGPIKAFNIITKKFEFEYSGIEYRIQFWKGRYGPSIGCEVGIYENIKENNVLGNTVEDIIENKLNQEYYRSYSKEMPMSIALRDSSTDRVIFQRNNVETWWLNAFIADNASLDDLTMDAKIVFPNSIMAGKFTDVVIDARNSIQNKDFTINSYKNEVNITWASKNFMEKNKGR